jgi:small subunit ribosomal protein S3
MSIQSTMRLGAEGIKINIAGRINGAEIARSEAYKEGRIPLHTFRADIDYANVEAHTTYGVLGIKCWICRGEIYGKPDLSPLPPQKKDRGGDRKGGERRGGGGGRRNNSRR